MAALAQNVRSHGAFFNIGAGGCWAAEMIAGV